MKTGIASFAAFIATLGAALGVTTAAPSARAAESNRVDTEHASSVFLSESRTLPPGGTVWVAFSQTLAPGWHVYWKNPGDSGLPLELDWTIQGPVTAGEVVYPAPERIPVGPLANFGHHGEPVFLTALTVSPDAPLGAEIEFEVRASWLICEEICVPEEGVFRWSASVSAEAAPFAPGVAAVAAARAKVARPAGALKAVFAARPNRLILRVEDAAGFGEEAFFFPEAEGVVEPAAPQRVQLRDGGLDLALEPGFGFEPADLSTLAGVLARNDKGDGAVSLVASPAPARTAAAMDAAAPPPAADLPATGLAVDAPDDAAAGGARSAGAWLWLLGAAFLGGVALNAMPCVFPILFIKAAGLVKASAGGRADARRHGIFFTAGVLASFAALGGLLLALRAGGEQLGWGFHLQSPAIVALSAYVLFAVGLNLAGVFHVGGSVQGVGDALAARDGAAGAFFTGVLAVVVAAPCIGPFLTAPIAATLSAPPMLGMAIFLAMGLGLAAPFTALAFVPVFARALPKPGPWMETFKQVLAFPVFGAAAYFVWILAEQTGATGLAAALAGAVLLAFAGWAFERSKAEGRLALAARALSALALAAALAPVLRLGAVADATASETGGPRKAGYGALVATPYDAVALDRLRAEGRGVFLDFTAAWCITCQFNKLTVLSRPETAAAFDAAGAQLMVADWTRRDPAITARLAEFGANGVPLYVYFPPRGEAVILPQPLTQASLLKALAATPET